MKPKLVYIEWADATSPVETWWSLERAVEWAEEDSFWIESIGWVLKETNKYILLAANQSTTDTGCKIVEYCNFLKIPKTWIRKRKNIKL